MACLKFILMALLALFISASLSGQRDCGTPSPQSLRRFDPSDLARRMTGSYMLNLYVHVFADDNGSNRAAPDSDIYSKLELMQAYFEPQDICFHLVAVVQHNNTDLNDHDKAEEDELNAFMVPDAVNMFIHSTLTDADEELNGTAYDIPNTYFSVVGTAITSTWNLSTTPHEMGHCLGLYHTFETSGGYELVNRTGDCVNCAATGDGLCDTPADPHSDEYDTAEWIDSNCVYFGTVQDYCDNTYQMDPTNLMAYGRRECRNHFTNGQGAVMRLTIEDDSDLSDCLAQENILFPPFAGITHVTGFLIYTASNLIQVTGNPYEITTAASGYLGAPSVVITPKVRFAPDVGSVIVTPQNTLCD